MKHNEYCQFERKHFVKKIYSRFLETRTLNENVLIIIVLQLLYILNTIYIYSYTGAIKFFSFNVLIMTMHNGSHIVV